MRYLLRLFRCRKRTFGGLAKRHRAFPVPACACRPALVLLSVIAAVGNLRIPGPAFKGPRLPNRIAAAANMPNAAGPLITPCATRNATCPSADAVRSLSVTRKALPCRPHPVRRPTNALPAAFPTSAGLSFSNCPSNE